MKVRETPKSGGSGRWCFWVADIFRMIYTIMHEYSYIVNEYTGDAVDGGGGGEKGLM